MIITCGQCQAKFKVAPEQIRESGSKVRCSNCQHVFTVFRPQENVAKDSPDEFLADSGDHFDERPDRESAKARRQKRRRLYSDLEDEPGKATFDDSLDEIFDDDDDGDRPSLRRGRRERGTDEDAAGLSERIDVADDDELPPPLEERDNKDLLGLDSDPVQSRETARREAKASSIRGATEKTSAGKTSKILLILAIVATALLVGLYYMSNRPEPLALSSAEPTVGQPAAPEEGGGAAAPAANPDPSGTLGITFSKNNQNHYFRENVHEGTILIITGMVRNSYQDRRSFIHLRGRLISADNSTLADRYAYAGNLVSEEELVSLPISEIFTRLSVRGGQNGQNMNVEPEREVPFMLVFDKLPDGMTEYRIDPMGSTPSQQ